MTERFSLNTVTQFGVETVPGTPVSATKRFQGLSFRPAVRANIETFRPQGAKFPTVSVLGKEWTEISFDGKPCYAELAYILNGLVAGVSPTQIGTSQYYKWEFSPSQTGLDTPKTFTLVQGSSVRAHRIAHGLFSDLTFNFDRDRADLSGKLIGMALEDGQTLESGTDLDQTALFPTMLSVYADDTGAGIGTTKLQRVISGSFSITDRWGLFWPVDASLTSFGAYVEKPPIGGISLKLEADASGMALLTTLRTGANKFIRIKTNADIGDEDYLLCIDACIKITGVEAFEDNDGIFAIGFAGTIAYDTTWGKALLITLQNKVSAL